MHSMLYKYEDEIVEFYSKACKLHQSDNLGSEMKIEFANPVGLVLTATTKAGDKFSVVEDGEPAIEYALPSESITLRVKTQCITDLDFDVQVEKTQEGFVVFDGLFHSLDGVESYIENMINQGLDPELDTDYSPVDESEKIVFKKAYRI